MNNFDFKLDSFVMQVENLALEPILQNFLVS
jgi:hypothetical protein